jgi:hypothetical protein
MCTGTQNVENEGFTNCLPREVCFFFQSCQKKKTGKNKRIERHGPNHFVIEVRILSSQILNSNPEPTFLNPELTFLNSESKFLNPEPKFLNPEP